MLSYLSNCLLSGLLAVNKQSNILVLNQIGRSSELKLAIAVPQREGVSDNSFGYVLGLERWLPQQSLALWRWRYCVSRNHKANL
jgi:hypothetical protein